MKPRKSLVWLLALLVTACGTLGANPKRIPNAVFIPSAQTQTAGQAQINAQVAATATALHLTAQATLPSLPPAPTATDVLPTPLPTPILVPATPNNPQPTTTSLPSPTAVSTPDKGTPQIIAFTVTPQTFHPGDTISIAWEAVGERAILCFTGNWDEQTPDNCVEVPVTGSRSMTTNEKADLKEYFELRVYTGQTMTQAHSYVNVYCRDSEAWFFDYSRGCPATAISYSYAAAQRFEHGWMIWVKATDQFYVLVEGQPGVTASVWHSYHSLQLKPGASADNRVGETPPPSYVEPVSGFGLIWRGEVVGTEGTREELGWARAAEFGFDTAYQYAQSSTGHTSYFLRGPDNIVFNLQTHSMIGWVWEYVKQ